MLGILMQTETSHTFILQYSLLQPNSVACVLPVLRVQDLDLSHPTQTAQVSSYPPIPQIL